MSLDRVQLGRVQQRMSTPSLISVALMETTPGICDTSAR
jgi:hypothetical protein